LILDIKDGNNPHLQTLKLDASHLPKREKSSDLFLDFGDAHKPPVNKENFQNTKINELTWNYRKSYMDYYYNNIDDH
jgi:hypothetical protein